MFVFLYIQSYKKLEGFGLISNARHVESEQLQREAYYDPFLLILYKYYNHSTWILFKSVKRYLHDL